MQQMIRRACGHTTTDQLYGSSRDRESRARWLATQPCPQCKSTAQRQRDAAETNHLPTLTGSPKQVDWAQRIRAEKAREIASFLDAAATEARSAGHSEDEIATGLAPYHALAATVQSTSAASWWIDHRQHTAKSLLAEAQA